MAKKVVFRQGDTVSITMELSPALEEGEKLKIGIYNTAGEPLYETYYPDENAITQVDSTHYTLDLAHSTTKNIHGCTTLRCAIFNAAKTVVNAGENAMPLIWEPEPVNNEFLY